MKKIPTLFDREFKDHKVVKVFPKVHPGMEWVLDEADARALSAAARRKVEMTYSQSAVASQYIEVYNEMIAQKTYRI